MSVCTTEELFVFTSVTPERDGKDQSLGCIGGIFAFAFTAHLFVFHDHEKGWTELHAIFSDGVV